MYTLLTIRIATKLDSPFLKILATIYTLIVFSLFATIATRTVMMIHKKEMFHAPCLVDPPVTKRAPAAEPLEMLPVAHSERQSPTS